MERMNQREDDLMKRTAELTVDGGKDSTPILRKYLGDEVVDRWKKNYASSDVRDPDGEE